jgi:signal transduction histidine kinase
MHDDLGSSLSTIALLSQVMKQRSPRSEEKKEIEKISEAAQQSLEKMSEIVWSLNPRNDRLPNLIAYIRKFAMEYFENSPVVCNVTVSGAIPDLEISGEQRRNIFLSMKEALHNIVKHSHATHVTLTVVPDGHAVLLSIHDNGKGIGDVPGNGFGNGLLNMQRRMREIGGEAVFENQNGTTVELTIRLS